MDAEELARTLVAALPKGVPGLFNPWADVCGDDLGSNGPEAKQRRLQQHLDCDAEFILCGEAAGWQGMIRVPWKGLGLATPKPGDVWGFNLTRIDQSVPYDLETSEYTSWVVTGSDEKLDRWGHLVFADAKAKPDDKAVAQAQAAIEATHRKRSQAITENTQDR